MGKKKAITNEALERRCWNDLAIAIILQALNDYTAVDGGNIFGQYFRSDQAGVTKDSAKRFRQKDAFLFLNSSWFELLNPTKFTGNELIRMARQFKDKRYRNRFYEYLAQVINGGTSNDQN